MECQDAAVSCLSWLLVLVGVAFLMQQTRTRTPYGRYGPRGVGCCPARLAWFLQEVPSFLLPLLLLLQPAEPRTEPAPQRSDKTLLLCTFMLHYFHR